MIMMITEARPAGGQLSPAGMAQCSSSGNIFVRIKKAMSCSPIKYAVIKHFPLVQRNRQYHILYIILGLNIDLLVN